eukprot:12407700-Karenia_brevis.AAC.1
MNDEEGALQVSATSSTTPLPRILDNIADIFVSAETPVSQLNYSKFDAVPDSDDEVPLDNETYAKPPTRTLPGIS